MLNQYTTESFQAVAISDVGRKRTNNEDRCLVAFPKNRRDKLNKGYLFVVADGMGGRAAGEVASSLAITEVENYYYNTEENNTLNTLEKALVSAHRIIQTNSSTNKETSGMGTTVTAVALLEECFFVAHVGDSRAYLINGSSIKQLTHDHTLTAWLASKGKITLEEARNHPQRHILTQAVGGIDQDPIPEGAAYRLENGEVLLLCTDGLYSLVTDEELQDCLTSGEDLESSLTYLIDLANERGGLDNITALVIKRKSKEPGINKLFTRVKTLLLNIMNIF